MQKLKIEILKPILKIMAKTILWKHKPYSIGVTGSVGKTTTKEAIYHLVKTKFNARESKKNLNNEIGVPLTIIGFEKNIESVFDLCIITKKWLENLFSKNYPKMLVLEMAIDRPNDMEYLLLIIQVDVAVVTFITNSHIEFFKNVDEIAKEKGKLLEKLKENSKLNFVVLNEDDARVKKMANRTKGEVITYGFSNTADFFASDINHIFEEGHFQGLSFKLNYEGKTIPIRLNYVLADYHVYNILSAICVAVNLKINVVELAKQISSFRPPIGRMNLVKGVNSSSIIDDTYNAAMKSTESAVEMLAKIPSQRKIAILGDMLELGKDSESDHEKITRCLIDNKIDVVFLVGKRMREAGKKVFEVSDKKIKVEFFDDPMSAGSELVKIVDKGDLILVKGSRGMRMEKVVEQVMEDKDNMKSLLCCQDEKWKKKEYRMP